MRDHDPTAAGADDCPDDLRDLLPALLHGRLDGAERARVEAHAAACAACAAELALLGGARSALVAAGPAVNVAAIAAAVRAATVPATPAGPPTPALPSGATGARTVAPTTLRRAPRWRMRRAWQAVAATLVLAAGSGALLRWQSPGGVRESVVSASAPAAAATDAPAARAVAPGLETVAVAAPTAPAAKPARIASAEPGLGAGLADLSDAELQSVLDAVAGPDGDVPMADPDEPLAATEAGRAR